MYELKTKATATSPMQVIAAIPHERKQADARALLKIFEKATGQPPVVWGDKQIGFGRYQYRYASGHKGETYVAGFAVTKARITLYLYMEESVLQGYLGRLGKAKRGKSCVYVNKLADIDTEVLKEMIKAAMQFVRSTFAEKEGAV